MAGAVAGAVAAAAAWGRGRVVLRAAAAPGGEAVMVPAEDAVRLSPSSHVRERHRWPRRQTRRQRAQRGSHTQCKREVNRRLKQREWPGVTAPGEDVTVAVPAHRPQPPEPGQAGAGGAELIPNVVSKEPESIPSPPRGVCVNGADERGRRDHAPGPSVAARGRTARATRAVSGRSGVTAEGGLGGSGQAPGRRPP